METDEPDAATLRCPPWCRTSAAEHATDDPGAWVHEGPRFGLLHTWWAEGAADGFTASLTETLEGDLTADELRGLAADALDAAMWLDRQGRTPRLDPGLSVVELVRRAHEGSSRSA